MAIGDLEGIWAKQFRERSASPLQALLEAQNAELKKKLAEQEASVPRAVGCFAGLKIVGSIQSDGFFLDKREGYSHGCLNRKIYLAGLSFRCIFLGCVVECDRTATGYASLQHQ